MAIYFAQPNNCNSVFKTAEAMFVRICPKPICGKGSRNKLCKPTLFEIERAGNCNVVDITRVNKPDGFAGPSHATINST